MKGSDIVKVIFSYKGKIKDLQSAIEKEIKKIALADKAKGTK